MSLIRIKVIDFSSNFSTSLIAMATQNTSPPCFHNEKVDYRRPNSPIISSPVCERSKLIQNRRFHTMADTGFKDDTIEWDAINLSSSPSTLSFNLDLKIEESSKNQTSGKLVKNKSFRKRLTQSISWLMSTLFNKQQ